MRLPGETGQSLHQNSWPVQGTCNKGHFNGVLCETFMHGANWSVILQTKNGVKMVKQTYQLQLLSDRAEII